VTARLQFDSEHAEASVKKDTIIRATPHRRAFDDVCKRAPTQRGWFVGIKYRSTTAATTVVCRFPGRFSVHTHPVSPSWAGERPAGSAVYLVLGKRAKPGPGVQRTIVASATVLERPEESRLTFSPKYCARG
jgi:hypothetical protein